jgi:NAD-dependent histone deacetylase SIR2
MNSYIKEGKLLYCPNCKDIACKHKVVFYGEQLPNQFSESIDKLIESDLVFMMGSSFKVTPFCQLPLLLDKNCLRVLVNKEKVSGFDFDSINSRDIFVESFTDDAVQKIVKYCGFEVNSLYNVF